MHRQTKRTTNNQLKGGAHHLKNCNKTMISTNTINYNRPTMSCKIDFYNMLVLFFKATEKFGKPNEEQKAIANKINTFGDNNTQNTTIENLVHFDMGTINSLRPMHKRKARLYNLLVAYADYGRFDIFEQLLKAIKVARTKNDAIEKYYPMVNLLGFGEDDDVMNFLLADDTILENETLGNEYSTICPVAVALMAQADIKKEDESTSKTYTLEIRLNVTPNEYEEFLSYLDTFKNVSITQK